jgi:hypothetical protein
MPSGRGGGSRRPSVEGVGASGAAPAFDGNMTRDVTSWLFQNEDWTPDKWPSLEEELLYFTASGHLAWVVFPFRGFRI